MYPIYFLKLSQIPTTKALEKGHGSRISTQCQCVTTNSNPNKLRLYVEVSIQKFFIPPRLKLFVFIRALSYDPMSSRTLNGQKVI